MFTSTNIYPLFLTSINFFCWILLVCIYRHAFRHILDYFTLLFCTWFHNQNVLTNGMYLPFFMPYPEPPMGISIVGSFPVQFGGSLIIFQLSRCRNLALNRVFLLPTFEAGMGVVSLRGCLPHTFRHPHMFGCPLYVLTPLHICVPPMLAPLYICVFLEVSACDMGIGTSMYPICLGSGRHQLICQAFWCLSAHQLSQSAD